MKVVAYREYIQHCIDTGLLQPVLDRIHCNEIAWLTAREERGKNRALLFKNVADSPAEVAANLFGSRQRICRAMSVKSLPQLFARVDAAIEDQAEQKEGCRTPEGYTTIVRPDLADIIPLIKYSREDATPYLTAGIVLVKDPASGQFHICYVRMAFVGSNKLIFNAATPRIRRIVDSTVGKGNMLDVAILIGPPTEIILMAGMSMPKGIDKLKVAMALSRGEISLTRDQTTTYVFPSEFVFKATVIPEYASEGPFGDLKGLYSYKSRNPICLVKKVFHRKNPLFHSVSAGTSNEHFWLVTMGARYHLEKLKRTYDYFLRYAMPSFGVGRIAFLVMKENFDREEFVQHLWKTPITRTFVFVNRDVNTRSATDILWAVTQRARDVDNFMFSQKKHPVFHERKLVIDATVDNFEFWDNRRIEVYPRDD